MSHTGVNFAHDVGEFVRDYVTLDGDLGNLDRIVEDEDDFGLPVDKDNNEEASDEPISSCKSLLNLDKSSLSQITSIKDVKEYYGMWLDASCSFIGQYCLYTTRTKDMKNI